MSSPATVRPGREQGRVGLLGGSFNPAHAGHLHLSRVALKRLGLDAVWWMVSPQNPLKPVAGMASLADRLASAEAVAARDPRIRATAIEQALGSAFTADTLAKLHARFPRVRFVWLMGADNMIQIPRWKDWTRIFQTTPVAVIARPAYSRRVMHGKAALRYGRARLRDRSAKQLAGRAPPAWLYLATRLHPAAATEIRAGRQTPFGGPRAY